MADNFEANPGSGGDTFAADDVGGVKYPYSKIDIGGDGVSSPVTSGNPLPVTDAAISAKMPAMTTTIPYNDVSAPPVRPVGEDVWNCSFSDVGASTLASEFTLRKSGTGIGYSQAAGALAITSGTSANQEWLARSVRSWRGSLQLRYSTVLSQRIANNNFAVLLCDKIGETLSVTINSAVSISVTLTAHGYTAVNVGQFMLIGNITGAAGVPGRFAIASIPDANTINFTVAGWPASGSCTVDLFGHSYVRCLYTSTTATNVAFDTQRRGWANGDTTATCLTTASPGHIAQVHCDGRNAYLANSLRASTTTPNMTMCSNKIESLPDDNLDLYVYLWCYNGTSNPATTTTWTISFCSVEKFANFPVYIQGQRMQGAAAPAPVTQVGTVTISGSVTATGIAGAAAHDAAISGNPVRLAGRALTADYTAVASGDVADLKTTLVGALVTKAYAIPELDWTYAAASGGITNTTGVTIKAAAAAGIRNYITNIQIGNNSAVVTDVQIRDGAAGTVIWRGVATANMPVTDFTFTTPLKGTAATLLEVACGTTASATYVNAQGYTAP